MSSNKRVEVVRETVSVSVPANTLQADSNKFAATEANPAYGTQYSDYNTKSTLDAAKEGAIHYAEAGVEKAKIIGTAGLEKAKELGTAGIHKAQELGSAGIAKAKELTSSNVEPGGVSRADLDRRFAPEHTFVPQSGVDMKTFDSQQGMYRQSDLSHSVDSQHGINPRAEADLNRPVHYQAAPQHSMSATIASSNTQSADSKFTSAPSTTLGSNAGILASEDVHTKSALEKAKDLGAAGVHKAVELGAAGIHLAQDLASAGLAKLTSSGTTSAVTSSSEKALVDVPQQSVTSTTTTANTQFAGSKYHGTSGETTVLGSSTATVPAEDIHTKSTLESVKEGTVHYAEVGAHKAAELGSVGVHKAAELGSAGVHKAAELGAAGFTKAKELTSAGVGKTLDLASAGLKLAKEKWGTSSHEGAVEESSLHPSNHPQQASSSLYSSVYRQPEASHASVSSTLHHTPDLTHRSSDSTLSQAHYQSSTADRQAEFRVQPQAIVQQVDKSTFQTQAGIAALPPDVTGAHQGTGGVAWDVPLEENKFGVVSAQPVDNVPRVSDMPPSQFHHHDQSALTGVKEGAIHYAEVGVEKAKEIGAIGLEKAKELGSAGLHMAQDLGAAGLAKAKELTSSSTSSSTVQPQSDFYQRDVSHQSHQSSMPQQSMSSTIASHSISNTADVSAKPSLLEKAVELGTAGIHKAQELGSAGIAKAKELATSSTSSSTAPQSEFYQKDVSQPSHYSSMPQQSMSTTVGNTFADSKHQSSAPSTFSSNTADVNSKSTLETAKDIGAAGLAKAVELGAAGVHMAQGLGAAGLAKAKELTTSSSTTTPAQGDIYQQSYRSDIPQSSTTSSTFSSNTADSNKPGLLEKAKELGTVGIHKAQELGSAGIAKAKELTTGTTSSSSTGPDYYHKDSQQSMSSNIGSSNLGSSSLGSSNLGSSNLGSSNLGSSNLGSSNLGSSNLGSSNLGSSNLGSSNLGSSNLGSSNLGSSNLGSSNIGSSNIHTMGATLIGKPEQGEWLRASDLTQQSSTFDRQPQSNLSSSIPYQSDSSHRSSNLSQQSSSFDRQPQSNLSSNVPYQSESHRSSDLTQPSSGSLGHSGHLAADRDDRHSSSTLNNKSDVDRDRRSSSNLDNKSDVDREPTESRTADLTNLKLEPVVDRSDLTAQLLPQSNTMGTTLAAPISLGSTAIHTPLNMGSSALNAGSSAVHSMGTSGFQYGSSAVHAPSSSASAAPPAPHAIPLQNEGTYDSQPSKTSSAFGDRISQFFNKGHIGNRLFTYLDDQDNQRSGIITWAQLSPVLNQFGGWDQNQAQAAWWTIDDKRTGSMTRSEFVKFCELEQCREHVQRLEAELTGKAGTGTFGKKITKEELMAENPELMAQSSGHSSSVQSPKLH